MCASVSFGWPRTCRLLVGEDLKTSQVGQSCSDPHFEDWFSDWLFVKSTSNTKINDKTTDQLTEATLCLSLDSVSVSFWSNRRLQEDLNHSGIYSLIKCHIFSVITAEGVTSTSQETKKLLTQFSLAPSFQKGLTASWEHQRSSLLHQYFSHSLDAVITLKHVTTDYSLLIMDVLYFIHHLQT